MKRIICFFVLLMFTGIVFGDEPFQGDLSFRNNSTISFSVVLESISIPFEGLNRSIPNNRFEIIQNGIIFRRYSYTNPNEYLQWQVVKHNFTVSPGGSGNQVNLAFCSANPGESSMVYGFAKYLITITTQNNVVYKFYFNTLDSKYNDVVNGLTYGNDFYVDFNGENAPIHFWGACGDWYIDVYVPQQPIQELKVWELIYNQPNPVETIFWVHSTPFGYYTNDLYYLPYRTEYYIGPCVKLGFVDQYSETTIYGYNTLYWIGGQITLDYYNNPPIPPNQNVPGSTFVTPCSHVEIDNVYYGGTNFIAEQENIFELGSNKNFWISSRGEASAYLTGDKLTMKNGSHLNLGNGSKIQTWRMGKFIDEGSIKNLGSGVLFKAWTSESTPKSEIQFSGNNVTHMLNNGAVVEIQSGCTLTVGDNTTLVFDGPSTNLVLNPNSIVKLGNNAKIIFQNNAYITASNVTFSGITANSIWNGIIFDNTNHQISINNCTFMNGRVPIKILYGPGTAGNSISITNNSITLPEEMDTYGMYAENVTNILVSGNTFYLPTNSPVNAGIYIKNFNTTGAGEEENTITINIIDNIFNQGYIPVILANFVNSYSPCYIYNNIFNGNNTIGFLGRLIGGDIKNNRICQNTPYGNVGIQLTQSAPNLLSNIINSAYYNIYITSNSYPKMNSLTTAGDQTYWIGGLNTIYAQNGDNIKQSGIIHLDYGNNTFVKGNISAYHLFGYLSQNPYYVRENCFNSVPSPVTLLLNGNGQQIIPIYDPNYNCQFNYNYDNTELIEKGFDIYDTIRITYNTGFQTPTDEEVYAQAYNYKINDEFINSIATYKSLIDNYTTSSYLTTALYDIYECYEGLDTSSNQETRNILYGNLKSYLEDKIESQLYNFNFNDIAYNITLMCDANMTEYNEALDGYEFLALYHPDYYTRLIASWDYAEVFELLGLGGSISEKIVKMTNEEYTKYRLKKMQKIIKSDPTKSKMKKSYDEQVKYHDKNICRMLNISDESTAIAKTKIQEIKKQEKNIENRTIYNLRNSKSMTPIEKQKRRIEDLVINSPVDAKPVENKSNSAPNYFDISQNYPNPFNPVTNIKYNLPKDIFVTIKIYDITGREIKTLINEFKTSGSHIVTFNGTEFASGMYFYRIQAGEFTQVKKMVLIK